MASPETTQRSPRAALAALVAGQSVSLVGDSALVIAVGWTAVRLGGAGMVTALLLCVSIPKVVTLIFGGAVADLFGPRFMLMRTTSARVVLLAGGAVAVHMAESAVTILVIAAVESALLGLGSPSFGSILPRVIPESHLIRANSLYAMVTRLAPVAGAPIGAVLIATGELWVTMAVVAMTCSVSLMCLFYVTRGMVRPPRADGRVSLLRRSADGWHLLRDNVSLRCLFLSAFVIDFTFGWPLSAALPLLSDERGWGVHAVGTVIAAFSAGALVTTAIGSLVAHRLPLGFRFGATACVIAAGLLTMALMPTMMSMAAVAAVVGMASGLNGPSIVTLYQALVPKDRMGAAMATLALAGIGTAPFSMAAFGGVAMLIGVQATWVLCGVLAMAGPVMAARVLRNATRAATAEPVPPAPAATLSRR